MRSRPFRTALPPPTPAVPGIVVVAVSLAACGGGSDATTTTGSGTAPPAAATDPSATDGPTASSGTGPVADPAAFPVEIDHRYGTTAIERRPERIVSLDVQWTDALLAMGETPTAFVVSSSAGERGPHPWQVGLLDEAERIDAVDTIPYEQIAAADPDLILVTFAVVDQVAFDTLAEIAPTIGLLGELQVDPWQDQIEVLGRALGEPDRAEAVVAGVDEEVAAVAAALPGLEGATYTFANVVPGDGIYVIADPDDGASRLFEALGMEIDPEIVALDAEAVGRVQISFEEIGLLGADLVGVLLNGADPATVSGLADLPSSRSGALVDFTFEDIVGLNTPTPLSVPYVLELIRPSLELVAATRPG